MKNPEKYYSLGQLEGHFQNLDRPELERLRTNLHFDNINKVIPYLKHNLKDVIDLLVHIGIMQQIHDWRCSYCGCHNKRGLGTLRIKNYCDICEREYNCPIDFEWSYSPSRFVVDTLAVRNGLTVLWTISHLIGNSIYLPEVDLIKSPNGYSNKNELDILAIIDGRYCAGEVKLSVSTFINDQREIDLFIEEINLLCPDIAVLAFEVYKHDNISENIEELKIRLTQVLQTIKNNIPDCIELRHIVAEDIPEFNNFPDELGPWGDRTIDFIDKINK